MNTEYYRGRRGRRARTIAAVLALAAALLPALWVGSGPAFASTEHNRPPVIPFNHRTGGFTGYVIKDYTTGRCLDSNTSNGSAGEGSVYTLPCNGGKYQRWDGTWDPAWPNGGAYMLHDEATGYCLTMFYNQVWTNQCADQFWADSMEWHLTSGPGTFPDAFQLKSDSDVGIYNGTDGCTDSNENGNVYENPCQNANGFQNWFVVPGPG